MKKAKKKQNKGPLVKASQIMQDLDQIDHDNARAQEDLKDMTHPQFNQDNSMALPPEPSIIEDFDTQISSNEPIRELLGSKNIKLKTEVTQEQRSAISILYHAYMEGEARGFRLTALKSVLDQFVEFGVAVERKGRLEYVDAHKAQAQQMAMQNAMMHGSGINNMDNMKM